MKLRSVTVVGLFGKNSQQKYNFNEDLNLITGRNGSGKTTLMKLVWFIISGNIIYALREVDFKSCTVVTSLYTCTVIRTGDVFCKIEMTINGESFTLEDDPDFPEEGFFGESAEEKAKSYLLANGGSIFFPTFRRIEGGFSLLQNSNNRVRTGARPVSEIDEALDSLSRKFSNPSNLFVAAISTKDINSLLLRRYAAFSEEINSFQQEVSRSVIDKIKRHQKSQGEHGDADSLLSETREEIEKIEEFRSQTMVPYEAVRALVEKLFQHSGISFGKRLNFGDAAEAVNSDVLSAGEKQLLSFICYNAFHQDSVIFIDEPELSLHVDWQRQIFSILQNQNPSNQFIFATHSPFIYGKYPDKEVSMGVDKGE